MKRICGMVYGSDLQHVDHILPFCSLMEAPIYVTEEFVFDQCKEYYPQANVILSPINRFAEEILSNTEVLITALPKPLIEPLFFFEEHRARKKLLSIWLPHGNSDKENLSGLSKEKIALIYGNQMEKRLADVKVLSKLYKYIRIGNYRREFFTDHLEFFRKKTNQKLKFSKKQKTIFFAPSWENPDVHLIAEKLIDFLPSTYNLIIKPHPNSIKTGHFEALREKTVRSKNIAYIEDFPLVYPLLAESNIYVGDHSSIAYDFLSFNRPLYFLTKKETAIHKVGINTDIDHLFEEFEKPDTLAKTRENLYQEAFDKEVNFSSLQDTLQDAITSYFEEEIHLL